MLLFDIPKGLPKLSIVWHLKCISHRLVPLSFLFLSPSFNMYFPLVPLLPLWLTPEDWQGWGKQHLIKLKGAPSTHTNIKPKTIYQNISKYIKIFKEIGGLQHTFINPYQSQKRNSMRMNELSKTVFQKFFFSRDMQNITNIAGSGYSKI